MVDSVVSCLVQKLLDITLKQGRHVIEFPKEFKTLKEELEFVQSYIKDAEKVRVKDKKETLKVIVQKLRELLYDAEDIILDCELSLQPEAELASMFCTYFSPQFWIFRYQTGKKLGKINQEIRHVRERMGSYLPATPTILNQEESAGLNRLVRYPVLMNDDELVGLDNDVKKITKWLLELQESLNIVGIVGMGGLGKTTLAQKVYNNAKVEKWFDVALMVVVSQTFKFEELIKNMLRNIGVKDLADMPLYALLEELRNRLERKRCLVILDDVWSIDDGGSSWWESLKSVLPRKNSFVIVTTRHEEVFRTIGVAKIHIHHLELLSDEDSWSLFTKIAFAEQGGWCQNPELELIGKKIVGDCKGLPLAIKVVGGILQGKERSMTEWEQICANLKEEVAMKDKAIFSILELSYKELPSHLKMCMLCLAMLPEDYQIASEDMIHWWIGEGFVRGGDNRRTAYEIGEEYVDELISRCLLLDGTYQLVERGTNFYRVHDMVRDMIRVMAKEEKFICFEDKGGPSCTGTRRVGMVKNADMKLMSCNINFKSLRTLVMTGGIVENEEFVLFMRSILRHLKRLRVLKIRFEYSSYTTAGPVDWLSGIGSLKHLVCLVIQKSKLNILPDSIGNLQSLQILILDRCYYFERLPKTIASLGKLNILVCRDSLKFLPTELGNLSYLQHFEALNATRVINDGFSISELKKLTQIRELHMNVAWEDGIEEGDLVNVLSKLKQLMKLVLGFIDQSIGNQQILAKKVDHELPPLQQLSELYLSNFPGGRTPVWLNPNTLPNLRYLCFNGAENITHMSPEFFGSCNGESWRLEVLVLWNLFELEEEWPRMQRTMPFLRLLQVLGCPKLKALPCDMDHGFWRKEDSSLRRGRKPQMEHEWFFSHAKICSLIDASNV